VFDTRKIEEALQKDASIYDYALLLRDADGSPPRYVAYVVPARMPSVAQVASRLGSNLPSTQMPYAVVPVSNLPLAARGCLDEASLCHIPVINDELVQRWREAVLKIPSVEKMVPVVSPQRTKGTLYHIDDLLPVSTENHRQTMASKREDPPATPTASPTAGISELSVSTGPALHRRADDPATLGGALRRAAERSPDLGIEYVQPDGSSVTQSYPDLLDAANRIASGLFDLGLRPGDRLLLQLERNQDFVEAFWACSLGGYVPVPISIASNYELGNATVQRLHNAWSMLDKPMVLTDSKLAPVLRRLADEAGLTGFLVLPVGDIRHGAGSVRDYLPDPDDVAILLLTSGSTGLPKAVMQSHRALLNRSLATAQLNQFTVDDVSFNWMPLDHVGGIVMFNLRDVVACCRQVHAPTAAILQNPLAWLDWIDRTGATNTWAPNFAFALVNEHAAKIASGSWDLSRMRFILNAGEAIVARTARRFLELLAPHGLPATAMYPAWGMSETCSAVTYSDSFSLDSTDDRDRYVEVGAPVPGIDLRIVGSRNDVLPEGEIGSLQITGVCVTSGYFKNPGLNQDVFTEDGWFVTGDLGLIKDGRLTITGREKDEIIINGINYTASEIEAVVDAVEGVQVSFSAACAVRPSGSDTDSLAVFFSPSNGAADHLGELLPLIRGRVVTGVGVAPTFVIPVKSEEVPKTAIGKIQRNVLKKRFEAGQFDDAVRGSDVALGNTNTLPDWFCERTWQRKEPRRRLPSSEGTVLFFVDAGEVSGQVASELARQRSIVSVEAGEGYERVDGHRYRIDPAAPEDYGKLCASLTADGFLVDQVVHCWTMVADENAPVSAEALMGLQTRGVFSVLLLIQSLAATHHADANIELLVCSTDLQAVADAGGIRFEHAPILGLIKCAFQEFPWLTGRHVDLQSTDRSALVSTILDELDVIEIEREVAYHDGQRFVKRLAKWDPTRVAVEPIPFRQGGTYVITGGLGGVGVEVARLLLTMFEARLLLMGRSPMTGRGTSADSRQAAEALRMLASLPGEVLYEAADVRDAAQVQAAVDRATTKWGCRVDGIIHLAGVLREELVIDTTREGLADAMAAKALGAMALHKVLQAQGGGLMISFSSLASTFGWATMAGYAAANAFLDHFAAAQDGRDGIRHYCFGWSTWDGVGMSVQSQLTDVGESRGYVAMSGRQALNSLLVALSRGKRQALIGLESCHPNVRRYTDLPPFGLEALTCFCQSKNPGPLPGSPESWQLPDAFNVGSTAQIRIVDEIPRTASGEIDFGSERLQVGSVSGASGSYVAPRTELERRLASILRELVGVPRLGVHDNLFHMGGDSLMATRFLNRVREITNVSLTLKQLFETPTVAGLAVLLQAAGAGTTETAKEREFGVDAERQDLISRLSDGDVDDMLEELLP